MAHTLQVLATHSYPGYQFVAEFEHEKYSGDDCFRYLILTVIEWLSNRVGKENIGLTLGTDYSPQEAPEACFESLSREEPCKIEIVSLMSEGIWSLCITEPDMDRNDRVAVVGRSFVTNVGIRMHSNERGEKIVTLGVCIDIRDPENAPTEVAYAYRPAFIKKLFLDPNIRAFQAGYPIKRGCFVISEVEQFQKLKRTLANQNCQLPALVFTSAFDFASIENAIQDIDQKLGLTGAVSSIWSQAKRIDEIPHGLGRSLLGYSRVFLVPNCAFRSFASAFHIDDNFKPGDMLFIEPSVFGNSISTINYKEEQSRILGQDYYHKVKESIMAYSKRKNEYNYGPVVFTKDAMEMQRKQRIERIRHETENYTFDQLSDEVAKSETEAAQLRARIVQLERENEAYRLRLQEKNGAASSVSILVPDDEPYFPGEFRDLILNVLRMRDAMTGDVPNTRGTELLRKIVAMNKPEGYGEKLFDQIKSVFSGHKNLSDGDFAVLRELGIVVEETKQGDGHIRFHFKTSPRFYSISSTGSDVRGMKNSFSSFEKAESIYKV